jgi:hypothetical protein
MSHQTFEPKTNLTVFVKCYWTLEGPKEKTPSEKKIVTDGSMKMIFIW